MSYDRTQDSPIRRSSGASADRGVPRWRVATTAAAAFLTLGLGHVTQAADGDLDPSFGTGGLVTVDVADAGNNDFLNAVAIQSDGKIVVAGQRIRIRDTDPARPRIQSDTDIVVARFNTNGQLDTGFGTGGLTETDLRVPTRAGENNIDETNSMVLQDDGKIVVVGRAIRRGRDSQGELENPPRLVRLAVVRYSRNGELDPTFGEGGIVTMDAPGGTASVANEAALQPDGKLVVVGGVGEFCPRCLGDNNQAFRSSEFLMMRLNPDGSPDTGFGRDGNGFVRTNFTGPDDGELRVSDGASSVLVLSDGKIVVGGTAGSVPNAPLSEQVGDFALARYDQNGILDTSFGGDGLVMTNIAERRRDQIAGLAAVSQLDGSIKIVAAGTSTRDESFVFALARYNPDGSADLGFGRRGANGTQMTGFPDGSDGEVSAFVLVPGGKLLAAGTRALGDDRDAAQFALVRYQPNGSEDTTFGDDVFREDDLEPERVPDGIKFQAFEGRFEGNTRLRARGMAVQPDGKIVLVGDLNAANSANFPSANSDFALARFDSAVIPENITCQGRLATIIGTPGDDRGLRPLIGSSRGDVIASLGGKDTIIAQGGNDIICGGRGNDLVFGGSGSDRIEGNGGADQLVGDIPFLDLKAGKDVLSGGRGKDMLFGGGGNDLLMGGPDRDVLVGEEGNDELLGGKGKDTINGGQGSDVVSGGSDDDMLVGDLPGERGDDRVSGGSGNDVMFGGDGHDRLFGDSGTDLLLGEGDTDEGDGGSGQNTCRTVERTKSCRPPSIGSPVTVPDRPSFPRPSACSVPQCGG